MGQRAEHRLCREERAGRKSARQLEERGELMEALLEVTYVGNLPLTDTEAATLVESDDDYVRICRAVARDELALQEREVWVRQRTHFVWLKDFFAQLGLAPRFNEKTARDVLAQRFRVQLPEWLGDDAIVEQNLLDIVPEEEFTETCDLEDRLLALFFGEVFYRRNFEPKHLSEVLSALTEPEADAAFESYPILHKVLTEKSTRWAERSDKEWIRRVCKMLPESLQRVRQWTSAAAYLNGYPERLLEYVLAPEDVPAARQIPQESALAAPDHGETKEQALTQIRAFFAEVRSQIRSREDFRKVLGFTTGELKEELDFLIDLFSDGTYTPDDEDVAAVRAHFASANAVSPRLLDSLFYYTNMKSPLPEHDVSNWSAKEWIAWTVDSYLPYRDYQLFHRKYEEELEDVVARFSDWYIEEYVQIQSDPEKSLVHALSHISRSGDEADAVSLRIVVMSDCLPVNFFDLAESALGNIGLYRRSLSYRFAALPTTTEYNKAAVFAGGHKLETKEYRPLLEKKSSEDWKGFRVHYAGTLKGLSEIRFAKEPTLVVLNFLKSDEVLHSDVEAMNTSYREELSRYFTLLAEALETALHRWPADNSEVTVQLLTDHGATRVLDEENKSFDSQAVQKLFADEKYRNAKVAKEKERSIPENLWNTGYKFSNPFVDEDVVHFLPRGHNTVKKTSDRAGYMHGGLTPEEVIVPTAEYKLGKVQWKKPALRFPELKFSGAEGRAKFYIKRVVPIAIELQNLNNTKIEVRRVEVRSPDADVKHAETAEVPPNGTATVKVHCYFYENALDADAVRLSLHYEIAGETQELPVELKSEFKSAMSGGLNLRDL
jgi:hypothetical protein